MHIRHTLALCAIGALGLTSGALAADRYPSKPVRLVVPYEPGGGSPKITRFLNAMIASGAVRRFAGAFERWSYEPIVATHEIASEVVRRYLARKASLPPKRQRGE